MRQKFPAEYFTNIDTDIDVLYPVYTLIRSSQYIYFDFMHICPSLLMWSCDELATSLGCHPILA